MGGMFWCLLQAYIIISPVISWLLGDRSFEKNNYMVKIKCINNIFVMNNILCLWWLYNLFWYYVMAYWVGCNNMVCYKVMWGELLWLYYLI